MKGTVLKFAVVIAAAVLAVVALSASRGAAKARRRLAQNRAAAAELAPALLRLAHYSAAERLLASSEDAFALAPENLPLPVSLPLPSSASSAQAGDGSQEWTATEYMVLWQGASGKTTLEILASLANMQAPWRLSSFRLEAGGDGETASLEAVVMTVRAAAR